MAMDITQKDRDSLRKAQHKLTPSYVIGNIVEHKIQDPARYKLLSRQEQGLSPDARLELPQVQYESVYLKNGSMSNSKPIYEGSDKTEFSTKSSGVSVTSNSSTPGSVKSHEASLPITSKEVQSNYWLNMDRVEFEKLEWMSEKSDVAYEEKLKSSTHFNQDGIAVAPGTLPIGDGSQQYHDVESLIRYLDSTYQPQITYSLNVISRIAGRAVIGSYDAVFNDNIHQILLEECLLRVRRHIDSPNESICLSAMRCLKSLLCNTQVDEIFLDKMFPLQSDELDDTRWLSVDQGEFDIGMKDIECVKADAVLALVERTDVLTRFKYLLKTKKDSQWTNAYQDCIMDILIRFARHSRGICWVLNDSGIPQIIIENFMPLGVIGESRHIQTMALRGIKFLRLIATAAIELKNLQRTGHDTSINIPDTILPRLGAYYYIDCYNSDLRDNDLIFRLHIENLRLLRSLSQLSRFSGQIYDTISLNHGHLFDNLRALSHLKSTQIINCPSSLDWQFAAALIDLLGYLLEHERMSTMSMSINMQWSKNIRSFLMQWLFDLIEETVIPHQDISIAIGTAIRHSHRSQDQSAISGLHAMLLTYVNKTKDPDSNASLILFKRLIRDATQKSQLEEISRCCGRLRDPIMLPSYGFINFNTSAKVEYKICSIASVDTPYIMLGIFVNILFKEESKFKYIHKDYLDNVDMVRYLRSATNYYNRPQQYESKVQEFLLAQMEIRILVESLILLANYYHFKEDESRDECDSVELPTYHKECYSQLIFEALSLVGLMNPRIEHMSFLKDNLLERFILDYELHKRLFLEGYGWRSSETNRDLSFDGFKIKRTFDEDALDQIRFTSTELTDLRSIYLNCEQPGRFWILQPLIEYYEDTIKYTEKSKNKLEYGGQWFVRNISQNATSFPLRTNCTDKEIICGILRLNHTLMRHSPAYVNLAISKNLEEYLCLIGLIFLDDKLFLDMDINRALKYNLELLSHLSNKNHILFKDASKKIPSINLTLADFFNKIVDQYEATSYGDPTFTNFLLLFLVIRSDRYFRKLLFSEKVQTCLKMIRIAREEVWIPASLLLEEKETDPEIIDLIRRSWLYLTNLSFIDQYSKYHTS